VCRIRIAKEMIAVVVPALDSRIRAQDRL
jgi:hypothetical protein